MTDTPSADAVAGCSGVTTLQAGGSAASAAPAPLTLDSALAAMKAQIAALPEPSRTDLIDGLRYIELFAEQEADAAIMAYAKRVPLAGGIIGNAIVRAFNAAAEQGLVAVIGPLK